jgi:hypothetical protein
MQVDRREFFARLRHLSVTDAWRMVREFDRDPSGRVRCIYHKVLINGAMVTVAEEQYPAFGAPSFRFNQEMTAFEALSRRGARSRARTRLAAAP